MVAAETRTYAIDLQKGAEHAVLRSPLASMDNQAHEFRCTVASGGSAAELTGAECEAYFVRADGVTVMLDGAIDGSTVSVTLGANCYTLPGRFELAVKLTQGDTVHTILRVEGSVTVSRTDAMTGAGSGAHSFDQLEAKVTAVENGLSQRDRVKDWIANGNFRKPVNQRGQASYTADGYTIDRWKIASGTLTVQDGYISHTGNLTQLVAELDGSKTYTFAVCAVSGMVHVCMAVPSQGGSSGELSVAYDADKACVEVTIGSGLPDIFWAALYEGEYTAETLPAYMPKSFAAELLECMRYFYRPTTAVAYSAIATAVGLSATSATVVLPLPVPMRAAPELKVSDVTKLGLQASGTTFLTALTRSVVSPGAVKLVCTTASGLSAGNAYVLTNGANSGVTIDLSAEL